MDVLASIAAILVFTMACNLDTILLSMGYAARGLAVSRRGCLILAGVTTAVTWLSLALGAAAGRFLPACWTGSGPRERRRSPRPRRGPGCPWRQPWR